MVHQAGEHRNPPKISFRLKITQHPQAEQSLIIAADVHCVLSNGTPSVMCLSDNITKVD